MNPRFWKLTVLAAATAVTLISAACASTISRALADPARYRTDEVRISGRVVDSYSAVDRGAYLVEDRTGQLWVVSDRGVPRPGARVKVTGTLRDAFNLGALGNLIRLPIPRGVVMVESRRSVN